MIEQPKLVDLADEYITYCSWGFHESPPTYMAVCGLNVAADYLIALDDDLLEAVNRAHRTHHWMCVRHGDVKIHGWPWTLEVNREGDEVIVSCPK